VNLVNKLPHTKAVQDLLDKGERETAVSYHNAYVKREFAKAQAGTVINLSDLLAAKETLDQADSKDAGEQLES
jgi:hypothetical protein